MEVVKSESKNNATYNRSISEQSTFRKLIELAITPLLVICLMFHRSRWTTASKYISCQCYQIVKVYLRSNALKIQWKFSRIFVGISIGNTGRKQRTISYVRLSSPEVDLPFLLLCIMFQLSAVWLCLTVLLYNQVGTRWTQSEYPCIVKLLHDFFSFLPLEHRCFAFQLK